MNYGELKQAVLDDTHRPDLSGHIERFVRQCEGLIRRDLTGYLLTATLTDSDRASDGLYNLPTRASQLRHISLQGRQGDSLQRVSPSAIKRLDSTTDVVQYAQIGDGTVEFRGVPGTGSVFDILYYGTPAPFSADTDENTLLTDHESLYMAGSKMFLYMHTQDRELMSDEATLFNAIMGDINEMVAREVGGNSIAPTYNFSGGSSY